MSMSLDKIAALSASRDLFVNAVTEAVQARSVAVETLCEGNQQLMVTALLNAIAETAGLTLATAYRSRPEADSHFVDMVRLYAGLERQRPHERPLAQAIGGWGKRS